MARSQEMTLVLTVVTLFVGLLLILAFYTSYMGIGMMGGGGMMGGSNGQSGGGSFGLAGIIITLFLAVMLILLIVMLLASGRSVSASAAPTPIPPPQAYQAVTPVQVFPPPQTPPPVASAIPDDEQARAFRTQEAATIKLLDDDERNLYATVRERGGEMLQSDIVASGSYSKAKVTRLLDKLESKGLVVRQRYGMTNKIMIVNMPRKAS